MTQYMLAVHMVEGQEPPSEKAMTRAYREVDLLNAELQEQGVWVFAGGLQPATIATVVRRKNGETLMTDGPFAETKEQLGGFWVIEVSNVDAALDWATKATEACGAPVEVRPFQEMPEV